MVPSFDDLKRIVESGRDEGLHLEYKRIETAIGSSSNSQAITKAVTAFANSDGGDLLIGVSADKKNGYCLKGQNGGKNAKDWIEQIISINTSPAVLSYSVFSLIDDNSHIFYWIKVARSNIAPHQSEDNRYYKRNGSSSSPMEHFEIDDVRSRTNSIEYPLDVNIALDRGVFTNIIIRNGGNRSIQNITFKFIGALPLQKETVLRLSERGIKWLHPNDTAIYYLGSVREFLKQDNAEIEIVFSYYIGSAERKDSRSFDIHDFNHRSISPAEDTTHLCNIEKGIVSVGKSIKTLNESVITIANAFSSSGLHLASTTINSMKSERADTIRRYDIRRSDIEGIRDILGIARDQAYEIWRFFHYIGYDSTWEDYHSKLPADLKEKIAKNFEIPEAEK